MPREVNKMAKFQVTWPEQGTVPSHMTNVGNLPSVSRDMGAGTSLPPIAYRVYHHIRTVVQG